MSKQAKPVLYGGQALMEGVMMQGGGGYSMAVRTPDGKIVYKNGQRKSVKERHRILNLPIIRGLVSFAESMYIGFSSLTWSAFWAGEEEEEKLSWKEIVIAIGLALIMSVGLFVVLPVFIASFSVDYIGYFGRSLLEGALRIGVFLLYVVLVRKMPEIARIFQYHGAEHKTITTSESGDPLTPEAAEKYSTIHCRCGTSFILMSMIMMVLIFTFVGNTGVLGRIGIKVLCMPLVFGVAFEVFRLPLRFPDSKLVKLLVAPGLQMQRLTTNEPAADQLEVAITALLTVPGFPGAAENPLPPNVMSEEEYRAWQEARAAEPADNEHDESSAADAADAEPSAEGATADEAEAATPTTSPRSELPTVSAAIKTAED